MEQNSHSIRQVPSCNNSHKLQWEDQLIAVHSWAALLEHDSLPSHQFPMVSHVHPLLLTRYEKCTLSQEQTHLLVFQLFHEFILPFISKADIALVLALKDTCTEWRRVVLAEERLWENWQALFHRQWIWSARDVQYFIHNNRRALYGVSFPELDNISKKDIFTLEDMGILRRDLENARRIVRRRNSNWDIPRFLAVVCCMLLLFVLGAVILLLLDIFGLTSTLWRDTSAVQWIVFTAYVLLTIWNLFYVAYVMLFVCTFDWSPPGLNILRKCDSLDRRLFKYCGLSSDTKERKWLLLESDFMVHLLWIPLAQILFTVKIAVHRGSDNWSYYAIPLYVWWLLYLICSVSNALRTTYRMFYPTYDGSIMFGMAAQYWYFVIFVLLFYTGVTSSMVLLLGRVDGWLDIPMSIALIPLEIAFGLVICCSSPMIFGVIGACSCEEERAHINKKLISVESITGAVVNFEMLVMVVLISNLLIGIVAGLVLAGVRFDGSSDSIAWHWIFAIPLIYILAQGVLICCAALCAWPVVVCMLVCCGISYTKMHRASKREGRSGNACREVIQVTA